MARDKRIALNQYIQENLSKGLIGAGSSPAGAPVLVRKKGAGSLQLCADYGG